MGFNSVFTADKCRAGSELFFHDPEVFFDFPTLLIDSDDLTYISFQIGYDCVESIVHRFFFNLLPIKVIHRFFQRFLHRR